MSPPAEQAPLPIDPSLLVGNRPEPEPLKTVDLPAASPEHVDEMDQGSSDDKIKKDQSESLAPAEPALPESSSSPAPELAVQNSDDSILPPAQNSHPDESKPAPAPEEYDSATIDTSVPPSQPEVSAPKESDNMEEGEVSEDKS